MENKPLIIILATIGGIVILAIGFFGGILFQTQKTAPQLEKSEKLIEAMSSKIIPPFVIVGEVTNISGRTITLKVYTYTNKEKSLMVPIEVIKDAELSSFVLSENGESKQDGFIKKTIEFKDIKIGSNVNITLKVLLDGTFQGVSIIVFPSISI